MPRPGYKQPLKVLDDYLYCIIKDRRQWTIDHTLHGENGLSSMVNGHHDLLQHLMDAGLADDVIRDQILTMLIAGHDTSTAMLAWTFALLGQHPDFQARLVEEVDTKEKSSLLDQVIKESLRLYPPIHIGNRRVIEEMAFAEGVIPAGERMFYSIYLTHHDPHIWEKAEDFCPERFAHGRKTPPFSYIPFGGGPRSCIGAAFGQAEARIVIARLLQTHRFQFTNHKVHAHMGATLEPRPGVKMKVTRRQAFGSNW